MAASQAFLQFERITLEAKPQLAVVLGSGLIPVARRSRPMASVPFSAMPGLSGPLVDGHDGRLIVSQWSGRAVLVVAGRLHFYEGHSWQAVLRPIHVLHSLGVRQLLATNAAGGIHTRLGPGSLMAIGDLVDWTRTRLSPTGSPGASPFSVRLSELLRQAAVRAGIDLFTGSYAGVTGPNYETPAEIRALRKCGADAVGMSTVREIQAAWELGLDCAAVSCITNRAAGIEEGAVITHAEVLSTAAATREALARLVEAFVEIAE